MTHSALFSFFFCPHDFSMTSHRFIINTARHCHYFLKCHWLSIRCPLLIFVERRDSFKFTYKPHAPRLIRCKGTPLNRTCRSASLLSKISWPPRKRRSWFTCYALNQRWGYGLWIWSSRYLMLTFVGFPCRWDWSCRPLIFQTGHQSIEHQMDKITEGWG